MAAEEDEKEEGKEEAAVATREGSFYFSFAADSFSSTAADSFSSYNAAADYISYSSAASLSGRKRRWRLLRYTWSGRMKKNRRRRWVSGSLLDHI